MNKTDPNVGMNLTIAKICHISDPLAQCLMVMSATIVCSWLNVWAVVWVPLRRKRFKKHACIGGP